MVLARFYPRTVARVIFISLYTVDVLAMARFLGKVPHVMWRCVSLFFWVVENKKESNVWDRK
jgi:hypothetical protein